MSKKSVVLAVPVLVLMTACCLALPTADDLVKQMAAKTGEMKTFEADVAMTMTGGQGPDGTMSSTGHVATQVTEKDGVKVHKMCNAMDMTVKQADGDQKMQMKMVNDGEFIWNEMRHPQMGVLVRKMKPGHNMSGGTAPDPDPAQRLEEMKKQFDLKVVGEDTIDGQKMYILEGTLKKDAPVRPGQPAKVRMFVNEKDLTMRRVIGLDAEGKEIMTMDFTNMKINQPINADMFKYTPPPGARVMDMTKGVPGMPAMPPGMEGGAE